MGMERSPCNMREITGVFVGANLFTPTAHKYLHNLILRKTMVFEWFCVLV
jgi:hypothetical protein